MIIIRKLPSSMRNQPIEIIENRTEMSLNENGQLAFPRKKKNLTKVTRMITNQHDKRK